MKLSDCLSAIEVDALVAMKKDKKAKVSKIPKKVQKELDKFKTLMGTVEKHFGRK